MTITVDLASLAEIPPLRFAPPSSFNDDALLDFCRLNKTLRVERTAEGDIVLMPPAGGGSSNRNAEITRQLGNWNAQNGAGVVFDSSGGFTLPNGAMRSPDAAWIASSRLATLSGTEREKFLPLCPDFVIELMSPSDRLGAAQDKMNEYLANGARLGWLLDRKNRQVYVYRPGQPVEAQDNPADVSGDPELPGFVLDLRPIFDPLF